MRKRIFWNIFLSSLIAALLLGGVILLAQYRSFENLVFSELAAESDYIKSGLNATTDEAAYFKSLPSKDRVTLIDTDGTVVYDSNAQASKLESHANRPEFIDAQKNGIGTSSRYSETQLMKNYYYARLLTDGRVLRLEGLDELPRLGPLRAGGEAGHPDGAAEGAPRAPRRTNRSRACP